MKPSLKIGLSGEMHAGARRKKPRQCEVTSHDKEGENKAELCPLQNGKFTTRDMFTL